MFTSDQTDSTVASTQSTQEGDASSNLVHEKRRQRGGPSKKVERTVIGKKEVNTPDTGHHKNEVPAFNRLGKG